MVVVQLKRDVHRAIFGYDLSLFSFWIPRQILISLYKRLKCDDPPETLLPGL